MKNLFYLLLLLLHFNTFAQNFSTKDALEDLQFFNEAIINTHPINYAEKGKVNIQETKLLSLVNQKLITQFKPTEEGFHGSKILWESVKGYEVLWKAMDKFLFSEK